MLALIYTIAPRSVRSVLDRAFPVTAYLVETETAPVPCKVFNNYR